MTVPYTFATQTGNIPLAELDANFTAVANYVSTANTVLSHSQPNITSVGTLTSLSSSGNITANYFVGNGSLLTGITSTYGNSNVASYLPTYTGNVAGNFFIGNGSLLTGITTSSYGNANVEAYLPSSNTIIAINANVANTNSNVANLTTLLGNTDSNVANLTTSLGNTDSNVANLVTITTNTDSNVANLTTSLGNTNSNVANLVTITTNTNSNVANLTSALANTDSNVANLTTALGNTNSNVANLVTITTNTDANVANILANVTTLQGQVYSNANVANYLTTYTGNITSGNLSVTGNIYGNIVGNILTTPTYGSFYDTTTQTNSNVGNAIPMSYNTVDINNGITIAGAGNTQITFSKTGVYNIQFSAQVNKTSGGADDIYIWLDKNGSSVSNSATALYLVGNNSKTVAAWNFVVSVTAGDYYRLMWEAGSADIEILAQTAAGDIPAVPSVILTVVPVGA